MKYVVAIITLAIIVHLIGHFVPAALPEHIFDDHLDHHMRFHVFQSSMWILGIDLLILIITFTAFRGGEVWAGPALIFAGIPSQLAFYIAIFAFPEGSPDIGTAVKILLLVTMIVYFSAVILGTKINLARRSS